MSILENKSNESHAAGLILINQNHFTSSVHCSYYSCIQLMKHLFLSKEKKTEDELLDMQTSAKVGIHKFLIRYFIRQSNANNQRSSYKMSIGRLTELKMLRNDSDYTEKIIDEETARLASDLSLKILKDLKFLNGIK